MCLVIAVILAIFALNVFMAGDLLLALLALAGSLFFSYLMVRNIRYVKRLREDKKHDLSDTEALSDAKKKEKSE